jgi:hypothetical protein
MLAPALAMAAGKHMHFQQPRSHAGAALADFQIACDAVKAE